MTDAAKREECATGVLQIYVDAKRDAVLLPIYGLPVPFHIATIKSVALSKADDGGDYSNLRINFNLPGQGATPKAEVMVLGSRDETHPHPRRARSLMKVFGRLCART